MSANNDRDVRLLFDSPAASDGDLVFGANHAPVIGDVFVQGSLPLPVATIKFIPTAQLGLLAGLPTLRVQSLCLRPSVPLKLGASRLPGLKLFAELAYLSRTQRPTICQTQQGWQQAMPCPSLVAQGQQGALATVASNETGWQHGYGLLHGVVHHLPSVLAALPLFCRSGQQQAGCLHAATQFRHEDSLAIALIRRGVFQSAAGLRDSTCFLHQDGDRSKGAGLCAVWQNAQALRQARGAGFQSASDRRMSWMICYQEATPPPPGISVRVIPAAPEAPRCYTADCHLLFAALAPASSHLLFFCENHIDPPDGEAVVVPIRRMYFVINNVSLHRLPDGVPVPLSHLSLSLDVASWTWGFDALLPAVAEKRIMPARGGEPVELVASVNGTDFRLLAESISRERVFGDTSIRLSGRGRNAMLAAPYAPVMHFQQPQARTARQLMDDVLTLNGISLGWEIDWELTDWHVPAGVFARQGTWIQALLAIAHAAGGYLIPHPSAQRMRVCHQYPAAPWEWSRDTADFVLPVDAFSRESLRWVEKPAYNRVFVSGQDVGVLGQVTRAGTAGEVLAPMRVDALITEAAAARQRGIAVLADTGRQIEMNLRLPVLPATGIIEPGALVCCQDNGVERTGIVRSTRIEASLPEVWQTLGIQSHA